MSDHTSKSLKPPSLAIGPANYAGQATAWAAAVEKYLKVSAWSFAEAPVGKGGFRFDVDKPIHRALFRNPVARGIRSRKLFANVTHVALDGFEPYFHLKRRHKFAGDLAWLNTAGYKTALIAHGSDVRDPRRHIEINGKWSMYLAGEAEWREELTRSARLHRAIAESSGRPVFYSTPDLGIDLEDGEWLPVCLNLNAWRTDAPLLERDKPRVLHVPSKRNPPIKGTQFVDPVLRKLDRAGKIEYVCPESTPHSEMRSLVHGVDIVVDQLLAGSYGVAAIEAMSAGRITVGRLAGPVLDLMPEVPPIVQTTPDELEETIVKIVENRDHYHSLGRDGVEFTRSWHNGRASAGALSTDLGVSNGT